MKQLTRHSSAQLIRGIVEQHQSVSWLASAASAAQLSADKLSGAYWCFGV